MNTVTKMKIADALRGSQTGAIVACALDVYRDELPRFTSKAIVTSDGFLQANFIDRQGVTHHGAFVGSKAALEENIQNAQNYLRDMHHLDDQSLMDLMDAVLIDWIAVDYRR